MTEQEWTDCTEPGPMLEFLRGRVTDRKLRLFAVACCLRIWHLLSDERSRRAVEVAESYADGLATEEELALAWDLVNSGVFFSPWSLENQGKQWANRSAVRVVLKKYPERSWARRAAITAEAARSAMGQAGEQLVQADLLRDIFGHLLFGPVTVHPDVLAWNDRLVVRLARAIYEERRWGDMPILADALLDAGCDNEEVMAHCRTGGEHVRGCWVVDLLRGKE